MVTRSRTFAWATAFMATAVVACAGPSGSSGATQAAADASAPGGADGTHRADAGPQACTVTAWGTCVGTGAHRCCGDYAREVDRARHCLAALTGPLSTYDCHETAEDACQDALTAVCLKEEGSGRTLVFSYPPAEATRVRRALVPCDDATASTTLGLPHCE